MTYIINSENTGKMKEFFGLIKDLDNHILNNSEFSHMVKLLEHFIITDKESLCHKLKQHGFDSIENFVSSNYEYRNQTHDKRIEISKIIGYLSGIIQSAQIKYLKIYKTSLNCKQ